MLRIACEYAFISVIVIHSDKALEKVGAGQWHRVKYLSLLCVCLQRRRSSVTPVLLW